MLNLAILFLVVGIVASVLGASGVAAIAGQIAWVLFLIALVLFAIHFISGKNRSTKS